MALVDMQKMLRYRRFFKYYLTVTDQFEFHVEKEGMNVEMELSITSHISA